MTIDRPAIAGLVYIHGPINSPERPLFVRAEVMDRASGTSLRLLTDRDDRRSRWRFGAPPIQTAGWDARTAHKADRAQEPWIPTAHALPADRGSRGFRTGGTGRPLTPVGPLNASAEALGSAVPRRYFR
jgi:hypothetical protein